MTRKMISAREAHERRQAKQAEARAQREAAQAEEAAHWPVAPVELGPVKCSKRWCSRKAAGVYVWRMSRLVLASCGDHPRMAYEAGSDGTWIPLEELTADPQGWFRWLTETDAYWPAVVPVRRLIERNRAEAS